MSLAANLKKHRLRKGVSLQEVADAVGVSKPHIWKLEREDDDKVNPSLELLEKLATYYKTSIASLISEEENKICVFGREYDSEQLDAKTQEYILHLMDTLSGKKSDE